MNDEKATFWNGTGTATDFLKWVVNRIEEEKAELRNRYASLEELEAEYNARMPVWHQFRLSITPMAFLELITEFKAINAQTIIKEREVREGNVLCTTPIEVYKYNCPHCGVTLGSGWGYENFEAKHEPSHVNDFNLIVRCSECNGKIKVSSDIHIRPCKGYCDMRDLRL